MTHYAVAVYVVASRLSKKSTLVWARTHSDPNSVDPGKLEPQTYTRCDASRHFILIQWEPFSKATVIALKVVIAFLY